MRVTAKQPVPVVAVHCLTAAEGRPGHPERRSYFEGTPQQGTEIPPGPPPTMDRIQPTLPSICSSISRFISTAYSMGSSLISGSTNPVTIMEEASASDMPRLIR